MRTLQEPRLQFRMLVSGKSIDGNDILARISVNPNEYIHKVVPIASYAGLVAIGIGIVTTPDIPANNRDSDGY